MNITHKHENNSGSQMILNFERARLNKVCQKIHDYLSNGGKLSAMNFTSIIGAVEYRKRFDDLQKAGYPIKSKPIGGGLKEWYYEM